MATDVAANLFRPRQAPHTVPPPLLTCAHKHPLHPPEVVGLQVCGLDARAAGEAGAHRALPPAAQDAAAAGGAGLGDQLGHVNAGALHRGVEEGAPLRWAVGRLVGGCWWGVGWARGWGEGGGGLSSSGVKAQAQSAKLLAGRRRAPERARTSSNPRAPMSFVATSKPARVRVVLAALPPACDVEVTHGSHIVNAHVT